MTETVITVGIKGGLTETVSTVDIKGGLTETVSTVGIKGGLTETVSKKLTACSRALLEKLTSPQLVKNLVIRVIYGKPYIQ